MKKIIQTNILGLLKSKVVLAVSGALVLVSCGTQMGGYSETDGVYYDPNKDTLPEGVVYNQSGNQVGNEYDYSDSTYIQDVRSRDWQTNSKYWDDNAQGSDWGAYAGSETNYYNDYWGWGSPYGYYSPYWRSGFSLGFSWGWGSPWGYGGWYDPFWYGYSPFYYSYNPYWGYYSPYYGYYNNPYYYNYGPLYRTQRSGANGRLYNSYQGGMLKQGNANGFRTASPSGTLRNSTQAPRSTSDTPRFRTPQQGQTQQQSQPRYTPQRSQPRYTPQRSQPRYESTPRSTPSSPRSNDGGFRSGGFDRGSSSSSGGGFRSGGSSGGGSRSGGFR